MLKRIINFLFKKRYKALIEYTNGLEKQIKEQPAFTTLKIPEGEKLQNYLASLSKNEYFMFYLFALENELLQSFVNGKESDIYKGGLKAIKRIKTDVLDAIRNDEIKRMKALNE